MAKVDSDYGWLWSGIGSFVVSDFNIANFDMFQNSKLNGQIWEQKWQNFEFARTIFALSHFIH